MKKKFPLFRFKSLYLYKKKKILEIPKFVKFGRHYYAAVLRVPRWPSKPYDHMVANGGLNLTASGTPLKSQIDLVILGITRKCNYNCRHCYEHFNIAEEETVTIERWKKVIKSLQNLGVSIIVLSGGEPMLRFDGLIELLLSGDKNLSDFHLHTSGNGVTLDRAIALKKAGLTAAAVALDDFNPERNDEFKGYHGAFEESVQAIENFRQAGIFPYINVCLRKDLISSDGLGHYFELIKNIKAGAIVLFEPKPCGKYISENVDDLFSEEDRKIVIDFFKEVNLSKKYKDYPYVAYMHYFERPERFGCLMGGLSHFYIDSLGNVQPCVFLPVSFGSILEEDFLEIYNRMRKTIPVPLHKECPSILFKKEIIDRIHERPVLPVPYENIKQEWEQIVA